MADLKVDSQEYVWSGIWQILHLPFMFDPQKLALHFCLTLAIFL